MRCSLAILLVYIGRAQNVYICKVSLNHDSEYTAIFYDQRKAGLLSFFQFSSSSLPAIPKHSKVVMFFYPSPSRCIPHVLPITMGILNHKKNASLGCLEISKK